MLRERKQVLVVDDEPNLRRVLAAQLARDGHDVHTAADGEEAFNLLRTHHFDLVVTDLKMPRSDGMELLRRALELEPQLPVVILTAHGTVDNAVEALKTGAFDYITKPFDQSEVRAIVAKALRTRALDAQEFNPPAEGGSGFGIIGQSPSIRELHALIEQAADAPTPFLIVGESGTGKELVARALHKGSSRYQRAFIKVNCAALARDLVERELFGYEAGTLPGANVARPGRLELAHGGTLLLDEIEAVPLDVQIKLLGVLQDHVLQRVGGVRDVAVDVRLIATTSVDLLAQVKAQEFRDDLYYRLAVVAVRLPPLRERVGDIPLLARHFVELHAARLGKRVTDLDSQARAAIEQYPWPGNIRELENVIERAVLFCDTEIIELKNLPEQFSHSTEAQLALPAEGLKEQVKFATARLERELIDRALGQTRGNVTHAARLLKISRKGLQLKMKELGLRERDDKADAQ